MPTPSFILPSAPVYEEGTLYGLELYGSNFVPSPMSFTRATTATRVNADGLVELVPYNLVTYSEQFDNATWVKLSATVTANAVTSPSGGVDADTLTADGAFGLHALTQVGNSINGTTYTHSIYAKKNTNDFIQLFGTGAIYTSATVFANFDLNLGVVGLVGAGTTASIQSVGNGWYRCTMTATATATASGSFIAPCLVTSTTSSRAEANTLSTSVFLWGAQLVEGTDPLPYLKTETRLNRPRVDFSLPGCPNLLLEPQRTNLVIYSEQFDNWSFIGATANPNVSASPDGYQSADEIIGDGSSTNVRTYIGLNTSAGVNTFSVFLKSGNTNFAYIEFSGFGGITGTTFAYFDLANGTTPTSGANIEDYGNGWYRCSISATIDASDTSGNVSFRATPSTGVSSFPTAGDADGKYILAWGAQLELGNYSTSYIPTTTTSVTRNRDQCVKTGATALIGQTEGTMFIQFNMALISEARRIITLYNDINNYISLRITSGNSVQLLVVNASATQVSIVFPLSSGVVKLAGAYKVNDFVFYVNGIEVGADTNGTVPTTSSIYIGYDPSGGNQIASGINSTVLWKERLTNDQLEALTGEGFNTYAEMASYYNYTLQ